MLNTDSPTFAHWRNNLRLKQASQPLQGIHDGMPKAGVYRVKQRGEWVPVVVRYRGDRMVAFIGNDEADPFETWLQFADEPIDKAAADHWYSTGHWPGVEAKPATAQELSPIDAAPTQIGVQAAPAPAPIGHNAPPTDVVSELTETLDGARAWLKTVGDKLATAEQVQVATNKVGTLRELVAKADKAHEIEKAPHWEQCKTIDKRFNPPIKSGKQAIEHLRTMIAAFKQAEQDAADAARRRAEAEHAKKVAKAEAKGKTPPPPPVSTVTEPPRTIKSDTGRALSFRQEAQLEIDDLTTLFGRFRHEPEVADLLLKLARREWKATGTAPAGTKITQIAKVA